MEGLGDFLLVVIVYSYVQIIAFPARKVQAQCCINYRYLNKIQKR